MSPQVTNEKSLNRLIRAIRLSSGEFSLILVCANYRGLRDRIVKRIEALPEEVQEIRLSSDAENIYAVIREAVGDSSPDGVMVTGVEAIRKPDAAFANMNQLREEFRGLPFPVVLWGCDPALERFARIAPDFRTWAGSAIRFEPEESELLTALRHNAERVIASAMGTGGGVDARELDAFLTSFEADMAEAELKPSDGAELNLLKGARAFQGGDIKAALGFYRSAFSYWEKTDNANRRGAISRLMARCLEKSGDLNGAEACYGACVAGFSAHESLRESCVRDLCRVLREAGNRWDELERRASEARQADYAALAGAARGKEPAGAVIDRLEAAREAGPREDDPQLFIDILDRLHGLYFAEKAYGKAFDVKQERLSIEQQLGFRAFVGPGRVRARHLFLSDETDVAREIRASGRQRDVDALMERLSRTDCRLIVLHGPSGVGKSSLLEAGLEPVLRSNRIDRRLVAPVLIRDYGDWANGLRGRLVDADAGVPAQGEHADDAAAVLGALKENAERQRLTVLMFDQFEEFFFTHPELARRKVFFDFLHDALDVPYVKVVLSLREDYLHYLLECDRLTNLEVVNNNLLDRNIRYTLGNFPLDDARDVIQSLTERGRFHPEPALVDRIVQDLAGDDGRVRPIEIQILGSQLQDRGITTLREYEALSQGEVMGPEAVLVAGFLDGAVADCGAENEDAALMALYSLIDENGPRMPKSRLELANDLNIPEIEMGDDDLDLILKVLEGAGVIEKPAKRYQITHDYLAERVKEKSKGLLQKIERRRRRAEIDRQRKEDEERRKKRQLKVAVVFSFVFAAIAGLAVWMGVQAKASARKAESAALEANYNLGLGFEEKAEFLYQNGKRDQNPDEFQRAWLFTLAALNKEVGDKKLPVSVGKLENNKLKAGMAPPWQWASPNAASHSDSVWSVAFSPDGKTLASGSSDKTIRLWEATTGKEISVLKGHSSRVWSVAFSPDGKTLASGSGDNTIRLWEAATGKEISVLKGHSSSVWSVAFSPDGKTLASGSSDNTIRLWEAATGKEISVLKGHSSAVNSVAFSPDGKTLASGSDDNTIRLWEVATGKEISVLKGHSDSVLSVAFSPDGKTLASGSGEFLGFGGDHTIRLWEVATGKEISVLKGHSDSVLSVAFSPDGKTLASGSDDNTIRLWDLRLLNDYVENGRESTLFQKIHDLSFEIFPYKLEGIKMVPHIHRRIPLRGQPQPWRVFERPRPAHIDPVTWMIQNLDRMEPTEEPSD